VSTSKAEAPAHGASDFGDDAASESSANITGRRPDGSGADTGTSAPRRLAPAAATKSTALDALFKSDSDSGGDKVGDDADAKNPGSSEVALAKGNSGDDAATAAVDAEALDADDADDDADVESSRRQRLAAKAALSPASARPPTTAGLRSYAPAVPASLVALLGDDEAEAPRPAAAGLSPPSPSHQSLTPEMSFPPTEAGATELPAPTEALSSGGVGLAPAESKGARDGERAGAGEDLEADDVPPPPRIMRTFVRHTQRAATDGSVGAASAAPGDSSRLDEEQKPDESATGTQPPMGTGAASSVAW